MDPHKKNELAEIRYELEQLRGMIDALGKKEADIARRLDPLEKAAMELRDDQVSFAIRDAYINLINAGRKFTEIHMDLIIPPTVLRPEEEHEEPAEPA